MIYIKNIILMSENSKMWHQIFIPIFFELIFLVIFGFIITEIIKKKSQKQNKKNELINLFINDFKKISSDTQYLIGLLTFNSIESESIFRTILYDIQQLVNFTHIYGELLKEYKELIFDIAEDYEEIRVNINNLISTNNTNNDNKKTFLANINLLFNEISIKRDAIFKIYYK